MSLTIEQYLSGEHDEELNVLVAGARGYSEIEREEYSFGTFGRGYELRAARYPEGAYCGMHPYALVPPYSTSLDAARELLEGLTEEEWDRLEQILGEWFGNELDLKQPGGFIRNIMMLVAGQICVAWLIVKGVLE